MPSITVTQFYITQCRYSWTQSYKFWKWMKDEAKMLEFKTKLDQLNTYANIKIN